MNANNERIAWVDVFKFLGIWAIYIGHFGSKGGKVYPFVFTYHVPMFFFAAGFFASHYLKETPLLFVKKKTRQLMVPYAFFSLFALIVFVLHENWGILQVKSALLSLFMGIRDQLFAGSLWFIPCLYIMVLGDYFFRRLFKQKFMILAVAIVLYVVTQLILPNNPATDPSWFMNIDSALYYYIYYVLGSILFPILAGEHIIPIHKAVEASMTVGSIAITILVFLLGSRWLFGKISASIPAVLPLKLSVSLFNLFLALAIIYFNIFVAKTLAHISILGELGRGTLIFCGTEDVMKILVIQTLAMIGLKVHLIGPLETVIFSLVCLLVSQYTLVKFLNNYLPWTVGRPNIVPRQST